MPKRRSDGRYEVKVRISKPGEPRRYKSFYSDVLREAKAKAEEYKRSAEYRDAALEGLTVAQAIDYWLEEKEKMVRPQTMRNYVGALNHAKELIGSRRLDSITVDEVCAIMNKNPAWADGLPLSSAGYTGESYFKD